MHLYEMYEFHINCILFLKDRERQIDKTKKDDRKLEIKKTFLSVVLENGRKLENNFKRSDNFN